MQKVSENRSNVRPCLESTVSSSRAPHQQIPPCAIDGPEPTKNRSSAPIRRRSRSERVARCTSWETTAESSASGVDPPLGPVSTILIFQCAVSEQNETATQLVAMNFSLGRQVAANRTQTFDSGHNKTKRLSRSFFWWPAKRMRRSHDAARLATVRMGLSGDLMLGTLCLARCRGLARTRPQPILVLPETRAYRLVRTGEARLHFNCFVKSKDLDVHGMEFCRMASSRRGATIRKDSIEARQRRSNPCDDD